MQKLVILFTVTLVLTSTSPSEGQQTSAINASASLVPPQSVPKPKITGPNPTPTPTSEQHSTTSAFEKFAKRRTPGSLSMADMSDHEDAGILNDGGGLYTGVFAAHSIYAPSQFNLPLPRGANGTQTLFAPTTRATNGACIEVGTAYTANPGGANTQVEVYAFDFCKTGGPDWGKHIPVTQAFLDNYAGTTAHGTPAYALTIYTNDTVITGSSVWHAGLFNFKTQQWDEIYTSKGSFATFDPRGWSIFETWYQPGQCSPSLPLLGVEGLSYYQPLTKQWEAFAETMTSETSSILRNHIDLGGSCFLPDGPTPASYQLVTAPTAFTLWKVESSGH